MNKSFTLSELYIIKKRDYTFIPLGGYVDFTKGTYAHFSNAEWIEQMYRDYQKDPYSIEVSWRAFFDGIELDQSQERETFTASTPEHRILFLIDAYRRFGHFMAAINPIALSPPTKPRELSLEALGFKNNELKIDFPTMGIINKPKASLEKIIKTLEEIYCRSIGVEYVGFVPEEITKWLQRQIESSRLRPRLTHEKKQKIFQYLNNAELFEIFLHTKYVGQKRFSLEGGETLIPMCSELINMGADLGIDEFVIGMAHRGRLNVLCNLMQKTYQTVFSEFEDYHDPSLMEGGGDVKYHKGFSSDILTENSKKVHIGLSANPSHLESVYPIAEGKVKAKQLSRKDREQKKVCPLIMHGDGAIAGQGVIYETLQFYHLQGYSTGGTIHIVINNQIGFTTLPKDARSTHYCTDIAKSFGIPIFHVNAEDPEGCVYVAQLAMQLREKFHCDVFIDLNCYRKYGHNEGDEPSFTQSVEYKHIRKKKSIKEIYREQLISEKVLTNEMVQKYEEEFKIQLHRELEELKNQKKASTLEAFSGVWASYKKASVNDLFAPVTTAVSKTQLQEMAQKFCTLPDGFNPHPKVAKLIEDRIAMISQPSDKPTIDWGMAEHLALASLLWDGTHVRFTGQDSCRGTFSQRHALVVDQSDNTAYFPLNHLKKDQGILRIYNSPLSEYACLAFEFGYSLSYPSALVVWEAQFGDFVNGAQIIIDQYISSSEQKWLRFSGLVLLLPHGLEGQGPEHSSGRMERFLQLAGNGNMQITNPTTPAQYFHLLRRQVIRPIRKPLIVFTPKGLLRHPKAISSMDDLTTKTFQEFLDDSMEDKTFVRRLLICTGRIYYELIHQREISQAKDIAIIRIEQLYPFNTDKFLNLIHAYKNIQEYFWVQEEPRNMGAWDYIRPILNEIFPKENVFHYVGRGRSASPAIGSHAMHQKEQAQILQMAFDHKNTKR